MWECIVHTYGIVHALTLTKITAITQCESELNWKNKIIFILYIYIFVVVVVAV